MEREDLQRFWSFNRLFVSFRDDVAPTFSNNLQTVTSVKRNAIPIGIIMLRKALHYSSER